MGKETVFWTHLHFPHKDRCGLVRPWAPPPGEEGAWGELQRETCLEESHLLFSWGSRLQAHGVSCESLGLQPPCPQLPGFLQRPHLPSPAPMPTLPPSFHTLVEKPITPLLTLIPAFQRPAPLPSAPVSSFFSSLLLSHLAVNPPPWNPLCTQLTSLLTEPFLVVHVGIWHMS